MKPFLTIFTLGFSILLLSYFGIYEIIFNEKVARDVEVVTFDGFEGNTYFFTDNQNKAVTIIDPSEGSINHPLLENSKDIGSSFKIVAKKKSLKKEKRILVLQKEVLKFERVGK